MKLIINDSCDGFKAKTLRRAFELICSRLGIADYDRTVCLQFKQAEINGSRINTGDMCANPYELAGRKSPTEFMIRLARGIGFYKTISTLAHELVHVKQYIVGELGARLDDNGDQLVEQYMGCDVEGISYDHQPWEVEAHGKMHNLAKHAILTMESEGVIKRK